MADIETPEERVRRVPHVSPDCDDDGCYCPDDVFWARLLGDGDPCAPGKDWVAAAFTDPCQCPTDTDIDAALDAANDRLHKGESHA